MKGPPHRSDRPRDLLAGPLGNGYLPATEPGRHYRGLRRVALLRVALTLVQRYFKVLALELQNSDLLSRELALLLKLPGLDLDQFRLLPDQRLAVLHLGLERGQLLRLLPECPPGVPRGDACADQQTQVGASPQAIAPQCGNDMHGAYLPSCTAIPPVHQASWYGSGTS